MDVRIIRFLKAKHVLAPPGPERNGKSESCSTASQGNGMLEVATFSKKNNTRHHLKLQQYLKYQLFSEPIYLLSVCLCMYQSIDLARNESKKNTSPASA